MFPIFYLIKSCIFIDGLKVAKTNKVFQMKFASDKIVSICAAKNPCCKKNT